MPIIDRNSFGLELVPFQREHVKDSKRICWCGDPNCGGGLMGNPFGGRSSDEFNRAIFNAVFGRAEEPKAADAAVKKAREKVEKFILSVDHSTAWDDVVGNDEAKRALVDAIEEPCRNPEIYAFYGMTPPKGVLLYGPPGCGKTMFAKAAAAAVSRIHGTTAEVIVINGPDIQSPYVGVTEETIRDIFAYANEYKRYYGHPLTVFIDEADAILPDRTGKVRRVASYEEANVASFLAEMDGLKENGAFVILATNRPETIDEALLRDGRCDRKIKVERPNKAAVEQILRKAFYAVPLKHDLEDIVLAGVESFYNPHNILKDTHVILGMFDAQGTPEFKDITLNFCLEHIVSGAMVAGVPRRAKALAFQRDVASGTMTGITTDDVIGAVREIFQENKSLEHSYALKEFMGSEQVKALFTQRGRMQ